jgi:outer membrane immunogenic protein
MRSLVLSVAALSLMSVPALAQEGPASNVYGTIGYSHLDSDDADLGAITARVGTRFTPNLGIEGELSVGVRDDDFMVGATPVKAELEYDAAVYGVAYLPVSENFELFGRVGYGTTEAKLSSGAVSATDSEESWNYGFGGQYSLDARNGIRADWTRRDYRDDAGEADVYSLSFVRRF